MVHECLKAMSFGTIPTPMFQPFVIFETPATKFLIKIQFTLNFKITPMIDKVMVKMMDKTYGIGY